MLSDNIKYLRKEKGLSQEDFANRLNVVRQTVSKWENGLSVPDAEMLVKIATELDTTVNILLDTTTKTEQNSDLKEIEIRLDAINNMIEKQNEKRRKFWRVISICFSIITIVMLIGCAAGYIYFKIVTNNINTDIATIGGYNGPTNIFVTHSTLRPVIPVITLILAGISFIAIYKTRKK